MIAGFQYVTERSGIKLWQRPKRFSHLEDKRGNTIINLNPLESGDVSRASPSFSLLRLYLKVVVEPNLSVIRAETTFQMCSLRWRAPRRCTLLSEEAPLFGGCRANNTNSDQAGGAT